MLPKFRYTLLKMYNRFIIEPKKCEDSPKDLSFIYSEPLQLRATFSGSTFFDKNAGMEHSQ